MSKVLILLCAVLVLTLIDLDVHAEDHVLSGDYRSCFKDSLEGSKYHCIIVLQDDITSDRTVHYTFKENEPGEEERVITGIDLNGEVAFIPPEFFKALPDLTSIYIGATNIEAINKEFSGNAEMLDLFAFEETTIKHIGANAFESAPNLGRVSIMACHIQEEIHSEAFKGLTKLTSLNLAGNKLENINALWFQDLNNLKMLSLGDNALKSIDSGVFDNLKVLEMIFLNENLLEKIDEKTFESNVLLKELHLDTNQLKEIPDALFDGLHELIIVNLVNNTCVNKKFEPFILSEVQEAIKEC